MRWLVVDCEFNRHWYPQLIGLTFPENKPPSYARLKKVEVNSEWIDDEPTFGQIFSMRDLRAMDLCAKRIGIAAERELFASK